jgi:hypothetical protein
MAANVDSRTKALWLWIFSTFSKTSCIRIAVNYLSWNLIAYIQQTRCSTPQLLQCESFLLILNQIAFIFDANVMEQSYSWESNSWAAIKVSAHILLYQKNHKLLKTAQTIPTQMNLLHSFSHIPRSSMWSLPFIFSSEQYVWTSL